MSDNTLKQWAMANAVLVSWFEHFELSESQYHIPHCCEEGELIKEWFVKVGTADILLTLISTSAAVMLQVRTSVFELSECDSKEGLYEQLLELNATELSCCAFGLEDGEVVVVSDRSMTNVDLQQVIQMIQTVSDTAHSYKNILQDKN